MLTVAAAAKYATVSESLIRQWIREGTLPHYRLGAKGKRGKILIQVEDLDGILAEFKIGARADPPKRQPAPKTEFKHLNL